MKARALVFILALITSPLAGEILESSCFQEILNHIEGSLAQKTLVACDIDNTLLESCNHLGSVAWSDHAIKELMSKGISKKHAGVIENFYWQAVQTHVPVKLVDPYAASVIKSLQDRHIIVMGLTARTPEEAPSTFRQLKSLNIDLTRLTPCKEMKQIFPQENTILYEKGILFATPFNKKSEALLAFLEKNTIRPEKVIFLDDKHHHVQDVSEALESAGIPCIAIRFSGADCQQAAFNPAIAEMQWKLFPQIVSNEEAAALLSQRK